MKPVNLEKPPFVKALFYGMPGSYKTRLVGSAALDDRMYPCIMLEASGNVFSIRDYERVPRIFTIESMEDYNDPYMWLLDGQPESAWARKMKLIPETGEWDKYKCLIMDGATETQRISLAGVTGGKHVLPGAMPPPAQIQHFGSMLRQMTNWARLYYDLPLHVLVTVLEREDKDEMTGSIQIKPFFMGQSAVEVASYAYVVARMVHRARMSATSLKIVEGAEGAPVVAVACFEPSGKFIAKDQYGVLPPTMPNPSMTKIMDLLYGPQSQAEPIQPTKTKGT